MVFIIVSYLLSIFIFEIISFLKPVLMYFGARKECFQLLVLENFTYRDIEITWKFILSYNKKLRDKVLPELINSVVQCCI